MSIFVFLMLWAIAAGLGIGKEYIQVMFMIFAAFIIVELLAWMFFFGTAGCAVLALGAV